MNSNLVKFLRPLLEEKGVVDGDKVWKILVGGRSNKIWRVGDKVCKLYRQDRSSDLFPNNPSHEQRILGYLTGTTIAPELLYFGEFKIGSVLVYKYVEGPVFKRPSKAIAKTLSRLHSISTQKIILNRRNNSSKHILKQCKNLLGPGVSKKLDLPKDPNIADSENHSIIHGDPVAGNAVCNGKDAILIDWQCCAIGDASEDIACALSPAMQFLYGEGELDFDIRKNFIKSYDNKKIIDRYKLLGHLYHFRIAAYCLWKVEQGDLDYEGAFYKEKQFLEAIYKI